MRESWIDGDGMRVEDCLSRNPQLSHNTNAILLLIATEWECREGRDQPSTEDFGKRFPALRLRILMLKAFSDELEEDSRRDCERADPTLDRAGPFELIRRLGAGGEGEVWSARDPLDDSPEPAVVAVKRFRFHTEGDERSFRAEINFLRRINHPGILGLFEPGRTTQGHLFFAMPFSTLGSLARFVGKDKIWAPEKAALLMKDVVESVAYCHCLRSQTIHRDLKPGNIILQWVTEPPQHWHRPLGELVNDISSEEVCERYGTNDHGIRAKISDFGLATFGISKESNERIGTPLYFAPEQLQLNNEIIFGPATDVWALGVVFYELLTGHHPFCNSDGPTPERADLFSRVLWSSVKPPRELVPNIPKELETLCLGCLEKDPKIRIPSKTLWQDLENYLGKKPITYRPPSRLRRYRLAVERNPKWAFVVGLITIAAVVLSAVGAAQAIKRKDAEELAEEKVRANRELAIMNDKLARTNNELVSKQKEVEELRTGGNKTQLGLLLIQCEDALDKEDLSAATPILKQAEHRVTEEGGKEFEERTARCRADHDMLVELNRLDDLFWSLVQGKDRFAEAAAQWPAAFRQFGIVPGETPVGDAVQRIRASRIQNRLLAVLDRWLTWRPKFAALHQLLRSVDNDPYRNQLREAMVASDTKQIHDLVEQLDALRQPARFAVVLVTYGKIPHHRCVEILRSVHLKQSNDFATLVWLGFLHGARVRSNKLNPDANPSESVGWYRAALAVRSKNVPAWLNQGIELAEKGDRKGATECFNEAIKLDPQSPLPFHNLGVVRSKMGDLKGATECFNEAIRLDPTLAVAFVELGNVRSLTRDWDGAMACFEEAIRLDPKFAPAFTNLGNARAAKRNWDGAIACFNEAIRLDPEYALAFHNLGVLRFQFHDLKGASECLTEAIRLDPTLAVAFAELGNVRGEMNNWAGAIACFEEAIRINPKLASAFRGLGLVRHRTGDLRGAIKCHSEATRLNPESAVSFCFLGDARAENDEAEKAIDCYLHAILLDPGFARPYTNVGALFAQMKQWDRAVCYFEGTVNIEPNNPSAHINLGIALAKSGEALAAIRCHKRAIALAPRFGKSYAELIPLLAARSDVDGVIYYTERASRLALKVPPNIDTLLNLGAKLAGQRDPTPDDWAAAILCFETAIRISPTNAIAHFNLGRVRLLRGDFDGAIRSFETASALNLTAAVRQLELARTLKKECDKLHDNHLAPYPQPNK